MASGTRKILDDIFTRKPKVVPKDTPINEPIDVPIDVPKDTPIDSPIIEPNNSPINEPKLAPKIEPINGGIIEHNNESNHVPNDSPIIEPKLTPIRKLKTKTASKVKHNVYVDKPLWNELMKYCFSQGDQTKHINKAFALYLKSLRKNNKESEKK